MALALARASSALTACSWVTFTETASPLSPMKSIFQPPASCSILVSARCMLTCLPVLEVGREALAKRIHVERRSQIKAARTTWEQHTGYDLPKRLYHGTYSRHLESILENGPH